MIAGRNPYAEAGRASAKLEAAAKLAEEWRQAVDDAAGARELLDVDADHLAGRLADAEASAQPPVGTLQRASRSSTTRTSAPR